MDGKKLGEKGQVGTLLVAGRRKVYESGMAETFDEISKRRHGFIQAWRNDDLASVVETADADDMKWLLERIDAQIGEIPHHLGSGTRSKMF